MGHGDAVGASGAYYYLKSSLNQNCSANTVFSSRCPVGLQCAASKAISQFFPDSGVNLLNEDEVSSEESDR